MTSYERLGALFAAGMLGLYLLVVALRELAVSPPVVVTVTIGLLAVACGLASVYYLARALGERLAS